MGFNSAFKGLNRRVNWIGHIVLSKYLLEFVILERLRDGLKWREDDE